jgi:uncharacterized protein
MDKLTPHDPLLQFPCEFAIKVFGMASDEFEAAVLTIIRHHVDDLRENALTCRLSKDGKYLAITITIEAQSREQLDNIYRELTSHSLILMAL